jgi:uncharacterized protein DUF3616
MSKAAATESRPTPVLLRFGAASDRLRRGKKLREGISGVAAAGDALWVVVDETRSVERLVRTKDRQPTFAAHTRFRLDDLLGMPGGARSEADLEDVDIAGDCLWIVGSHAADREMPAGNASPRKVAKTLLDVRRDGNRCLLARLPLVERDGTWTPRESGAARLEGNAKGNALTRALAKDAHFGDFLALPGKENGFDVEGLAVVGDRVLLGLRGPVLNQWAAIVEIEPRAARGDPSTLRLARFGPGRKRYRKHFLKLDGLGIRGLCRHGLDILVLSGPVGSRDGPAKIHRWIGGARPDVERRLRPEDLVRVMELPTGQRGSDHPEGIAVLPSKDGRGRLLVVYERASAKRFRGAHGVRADLFPIPA